MKNTEKRYSPSEAMMATGLRRGQFTNRALMLGIPRTRMYTVEDIYRIASYSPLTRRKNLEKANELREALQAMFAERNDHIRIEETEDGNRLVEA